MQAYRVISGRNSDALHQVELPAHPLSASEVRVRVRAVSLNYRDLMIARGDYPISTEHPPIAIADGAGEVVEIGTDVTRFHVGDHVARPYFDGWIDGAPTPDKLEKVPGASVDGMLAEEIVVSEQALIRAPSHMDFNEIATLGCAGVTAWNALFVEGRIHPGQTVLLLGTGGVSIWALQLAKAAGQRVIITSSSDHKLERARILGADETINYRTTPQWQDEVLGLTEGRGADLVIEVGGEGTLGRSVTATRTGGTIVLVGGVGGFATQFDIMPVLIGNKRLIGISVGSRQMFEEMNEFVSRMHIRPVIDRIFSFQQAREAQAHLQSGGHFGKIVIEVGRD